MVGGQIPPLRSFQKKAVDYCSKNAYSILALDPGLGKSRVIIDVSVRHREGPCLVVCPSYLVGNWIVELGKWAPHFKKISVVRKSKDIPAINLKADFIISSYEMIQKAEHVFEHVKMVALDEAHYLKSQSAKRTQYIHRVIYENSIKRVILSTGTPIKNRVEEFYSLLALCNYDPAVPDSKFLSRFPSSIDFADHFSFRHEYTIEVGNRFVNILKWTGLKNVDELKLWLKGKYFRVRSEQVLDLPRIVYKDLRISDKDDIELKAAFDSYFQKDGAGDVNPTAKAQAALRKVPFTAAYVKNLLEETECVVIYTDHVEASEALAKVFNTRPLNGLMPAGKRMEMALDFQNGKTKVLVATIQALSQGVTLTRANHLVLNDYPWVPGDLKQTVYRIQRIGQTKRCFVHRMIGSPQDAYIIKTLIEKQATISEAT